MGSLFKFKIGRRINGSHENVGEKVLINNLFVNYLSINNSKFLYSNLNFRF
jgi:hypothetical protein